MQTKLALNYMQWFSALMYITHAQTYLKEHSKWVFKKLKQMLIRTKKIKNVSLSIKNKTQCVCACGCVYLFPMHKWTMASIFTKRRSNKTLLSD